MIIKCVNNVSLTLPDAVQTERAIVVRQLIRSACWAATDLMAAPAVFKVEVKRGVMWQAAIGCVLGPAHGEGRVVLRVCCVATLFRVVTVIILFLEIKVKADLMLWLIQSQGCVQHDMTGCHWVCV